jgi:hypothetical protein
LISIKLRIDRWAFAKVRATMRKFIARATQIMLKITGEYEKLAERPEKRSNPLTIASSLRLRPDSMI